MDICILEDNCIQAEELKKRIKEVSPAAVFTEYRSAEEMLFECGNAFPFDVLFLDIELKEMNGMEVARKIRQTDENAVIVFVTNAPAYAFEGYEVQALRYLLKPATTEKIEEIFSSLTKRIKKSVPLIIEADGEKIKIESDALIFIESVGHNLRFVTETGEYLTRGTFKDFSDKLKDSFAFSHRSYLVNVGKVERIGKNDVFFKSGSVPLSRRAADEFCKRFISLNKEEQS